MYLVEIKLVCIQALSSFQLVTYVAALLVTTLLEDVPIGLHCPRTKPLVYALCTGSNHTPYHAIYELRERGEEGEGEREGEKERGREREREREPSSSSLLFSGKEGLVDLLVAA